MADVTITSRGKAAGKLHDLVREEHYARPEDAIEDALTANRDPDLDAWLRETVVARAEALLTDPSRALTPAQVRERLAKR